MFRILKSILMVAILATVAIPANAKFLQPDWFDPDNPLVGTNRYSYCFNDPINCLDPSGNQAVSPVTRTVDSIMEAIGSAATQALGSEQAVQNAINEAASITGLDTAHNMMEASETGSVSGVAVAAGGVVTGKAKAVKGFWGRVFGRTKCSFHGETPVLTENGLVWIQDIQVGDNVWSHHEGSGEVALKEVLHVFRQVHDHTFVLEIKNSDGETDVIRASRNHPFFVVGNGWVEVSDLSVGDRLQNQVGISTLTGIEIRKEELDAYNLDVAEFDTFFVGAFSILVHNDEKGYTVEAETQTSKPDQSDRASRQQMNQEIHERMKSDKAYREKMESKYPGIFDRTKPGPRGAYPDRAAHPDLVTHHDAKVVGNLQAVPKSEHQASAKQAEMHPGGKGGKAIWGGGTKCR